MTAQAAEETATWVRVQLAKSLAPKTCADPAPVEDEMVLRADGVAVQEKVLLFLCAGEVVLRLDLRYFRALTWFVDRPTFGEWLRLRRKQYPNSHTRWTEDEVRRLDDEIGLYGMDWQRISDRHGRTEAEGRVRSWWGEAPADGGPRRRYYGLDGRAS